MADERRDVKSLNAAGVQIERGLRVVRVVIEVADWSAAAGVRGAVERAGGRVDAAAKPLLRATVPIDRLRALSETSGVKRVREPYRPKPKEVVSEGVRVTGADAFVRASRANGAGVSVGVLDAGFKGVQALVPDELPQDSCRSPTSCSNGSRASTASTAPRVRKSSTTWHPAPAGAGRLRGRGDLGASHRRTRERRRAHHQPLDRLGQHRDSKRRQLLVEEGR